MSADIELAPDPEALDRDDWTRAMQAMGAEHGFFEQIGEDHTALFVRKGKTLIVTFENLDHVFGQNDNRLPWGFDFVTSMDWSILGLMAHDWSWYRDADVYAFFDRLKADKFFDEFDNVVFYGASMGGYGACAFSPSCPGASVFAISPQATLDRDLCSWETRYQKAWTRDFDGPYGFAPDQVDEAQNVFILYDPLEPLDAMHASLFRGDNVTKLKCRFQGHRIASGLIQMKLLKKVVAGCVDGTLTKAQFYTLLRARRGFRRYLRELINRIDVDRHPYRVALVAEWVLRDGAGPVFRKKLKAATDILRDRGQSLPSERNKDG